MKSNQKVIEKKRADILFLGPRLIHFALGSFTFMTKFFLKLSLKTTSVQHQSIISTSQNFLLSFNVTLTNDQLNMRCTSWQFIL